MGKLLPGPAIAEAEQQDGIENTGQTDGQHHGFAHVGDVAAGVLHALGNGLKPGQEEGGGGQNGHNAAKHAVVRDLFQPLGGSAVDGGVRDIVDGLPVFRVAADESGHRANDGGTHQDEAQHLLHRGGRCQAAHVQGEQQQGGHGANDDGDEIDICPGDLIEGFPALDVGNQVAQHVSDLNGFPRNDGDERAKGRPSRDKRDILVECPIGEGHAAASNGEHGNQLTVAESNGDHHDQRHDVTNRGRNGAAAAGHPSVDGDCPANADDCAKANAEKVNGADTFLFWVVTHTVPLF